MKINTAGGQGYSLIRRSPGEGAEMDFSIVSVLIVALLALLALLVLMAAAASPAIFSLWRKSISAQTDLELWSVMRRCGLDLADTAGKERELGVAASLCVTCRSLEPCREWLAAETRDGPDAFCPNAAFIASLGKGGAASV